MTHRECRTMFVDALYAELGPRERNDFDRHLADCPDCMHEFSELRDLARTMNERKRHELTETEWKIFWNELSPNLGEKPAGGWKSLLRRLSRGLRTRPAIRYALAGATLLLAGVLLGRVAFMPGQDIEVQRLTQRLYDTEKILLNERAQNYLQRSKILLLGIMNSSSVTPSSMSKEQDLSRSLIKEASGLRSELTDADQQRMRKLIGDLEVTLLQIANLRQQTDYPGVEIVRGGVERSGLLLKINLEQMRAQEERTPPPAVPAAGKKSSGT